MESRGYSSAVKGTSNEANDPACASLPSAGAAKGNERELVPLLVPHNRYPQKVSNRKGQRIKGNEVTRIFI